MQLKVYEHRGGECLEFMTVIKILIIYEEDQSGDVISIAKRA